jgi:hypothetical protein
MSFRRSYGTLQIALPQAEGNLSFCDTPSHRSLTSASRKEQLNGLCIVDSNMIISDGCRLRQQCDPEDMLCRELCLDVSAWPGC